jgi:hypothetical protein
MIGYNERGKEDTGTWEIADRIKKKIKKKCQDQVLSFERTRTKIRSESLSFEFHNIDLYN